MIDIHCHILPGVDDGAGSLDTARRMAHQAVEGGTDQIVVTPHFLRPDQGRLIPAGVLAEHIGLLQEAFRKEGIPLNLYTGMEVFAAPELPMLLERQEVLTLAQSRYLLIEFFFDEEEEYMDRMLETVWDMGLWPVVAHPERYYAVQRRPMLAVEWFERGFCLQLNKGSVTGTLGSAAASTAWWLLRRGLAHMVASDAHGYQRRTTDLGQAKKLLDEHLGTTYTRLLLEENPGRILENTDMIMPEAWQGKLRDPSDQ